MTNDSGLIPIEFFVIVALDPSEKRVGSIIIPDQISDRDELSAQEGTLIAASPHAFDYADSWPEGSKPQVGQRVLFKRHDGAVVERDVGGVKRKFRLLNDKSIIAIVAPQQPKDDWARDVMEAAAKNVTASVMGACGAAPLGRI